MTRSTRIYGKVALLMAGILAASVLLTLAVGVDRRPAGKTRIVASFYPVYIAALNLADGVEGVEVVSLTGPPPAACTIISCPPTTESPFPARRCWPSTARGRNPSWTASWPSLPISPWWIPPRASP